MILSFRKASQKGLIGGANWQLQKCIGLLALGVVLGGLGVMNISLAVFIAVVWVPVLVTVKPSKKRSVIKNAFEYKI